MTLLFKNDFCCVTEQLHISLLDIITWCQHHVDKAVKKKICDTRMIHAFSETVNTT